MVGGWPWHGRGGRVHCGVWVKGLVQLGGLGRGFDGRWGSFRRWDVGHDGVAEVEVLEEGSEEHGGW